MYCSNCKITVDAPAKFCPLCGQRMSEDERHMGSIDDDALYRGADNAVRKGPRFNFSKPLSLILAALMLMTMLAPWISISATVSELHILNDKQVTIFGLRPFVKDAYETVMRYLGPAVTLDEKTKETIWMADGILLLVTLYFVICAFCFIMFGVIGLFSKGKARYFFARLGSTMYFIGTIALIAAVYIGDQLIKQAIADLPWYVVKFTIGLKPVFWLFIAAACALLFRTLGIRLLRYINGISCMNRGDYRTAEKEFTIINCMNKYRRTFTKRKMHLYYASSSDNSRFFDEPLD